MDEKAAFLAAIRANPDDDMPRLAYADWLDEKENRTDQEAATSEFIRLSLQEGNGRFKDGRRRTSMHPKVSKWLDETGGEAIYPNFQGQLARAMNLFRLMPLFGDHFQLVQVASLAAAGFPRYELRRNGRFIDLKWINDPLSMGQITRFEFWRGFLNSVTFSWGREAEHILPLLLPDQPVLTARQSLVEHNLERRRSYYRLWEPVLGIPAFARLKYLERPYRPDRLEVDLSSAPGTGRPRPAVATWEEWETDELLSKYSVAQRVLGAVDRALRMSAEDVIAGRRRPLPRNYYGEEPVLTTGQ